MPTIDLGVAATTPGSTSASSPSVGEDVWAELPRRIGLTLPELQVLAETLAAPLPFDVQAPSVAAGGSLAARLGQSVNATQDGVYAEVLDRLGDPAEALRRRGLITSGGVESGLAGALGLLAAPAVALDLDVVVETRRARAWHRFRDGAVATLATSDGLVFELAWFAAGAWPRELARVAALPEETRTRASLVPGRFEVAWQIADAAAEAVRSGRPELVPVLANDATLGTVLTALSGEARGRLRALVSAVSDEPRTIGVAAWTLLADGWHALRPHRAGAPGPVDDLLEIIRVEAADLPAELAPLLAEVA